MNAIREGTVTLYRAVSQAELDDIARSGGFRPSLHSMQGKWFAESADDAAAWGRAFYRYGGGAFYIVQASVPRAVADRMFRHPRLDGIGPARYADEGLLRLMNQANHGITPLHMIPLGY